MTTGPWRPMGQTAEEAGTLYEGVPPWAQNAVWLWIEARLLISTPTGARAGYRVALVDEFERLIRSPKPVASSVAASGSVALRVGWDGTMTLRFIDFLLAKGADEPTNLLANGRLGRVLWESGSAWKVGTRDGFPGLERRVPEGVQEAADEAMATPGHAGARLSEAWHKVYGVSPDPSSAYSLAVKAVEDAAVPVVVPKQSGATLGHVIGQLAGDGNWRLPLTREDPTAPTADTIVRMCKALWKGHHDRHGGDQTAPESVNQDEAEAAVHLAVFLVQGFASGLIARR